MKGRRPLSNALLLPRPGYQVRRPSLKHHLGLTCLAAGQGGIELLSTLSNVIDIAHRIDNADAPVFQKTDATIGACVARAERDRTFTLTDTEHAAIAATLVCHDAQLARVPFHRYIMALEQTDAQPTPLGTPGRAVTPGDQPFARLHNGDSVLLTNIAERHDNKISLLITLPASDAETRGP